MVFDVNIPIVVMGVIVVLGIYAYTQRLRISVYIARKIMEQQLKQGNFQQAELLLNAINRDEKILGKK